MLRCCGVRWMTTITAAARSAGSCSSTSSIALMAPADPTIATTSGSRSAVFVAIALEQGGANQLRLPECLLSGLLEVALRPIPAALPSPAGETLGEGLALEQRPERRPERRLDRLVLPVERGLCGVRVADAAAEAQQVAVVDLPEHPAARGAGNPGRPSGRLAVLDRVSVQCGV